MDMRLSPIRRGFVLGPRALGPSTNLFGALFYSFCNLRILPAVLEFCQSFARGKAACSAQRNASHDPLIDLDHQSIALLHPSLLLVGGLHLGFMNAEAPCIRCIW